MRRKILIGSGVVLALLAALWTSWISYQIYKSWRDQQIVHSLEGQVVPFIKHNQIKRYFNSDWCRVLEYKGKYIFELLNSVGSANCGDPNMSGSHEFTEEDNQIFLQIREALANAHSDGITTIAPEFTSDIGHKNIGVAFYIDCSFCRTRYVYSPDYQMLPSDIDGEISYTPVNRDWFRVDQDWY